MATLSQLIQRTILRISQVPGTGVQLYAEDRIAEMIQHKFDVLYDEEWWKRFMVWTTGAVLTGTTGVVTADLSNIYKDYTDIYGVWFSSDRKRLPEAAFDFNVNLVQGTRGKFITANNDPQKVFTVWPKTSVGTVNILGSTKPDPFTADDKVPFDDQVLILGATFDYLEDDGANPGAIDKFQGMFEQRVAELKKQQSHMPITLDPDAGAINDEWRTVD